jgi:hypothetical protein
MSLSTNQRKTAAVSSVPRKKQRVPFPASGHASASFALLRNTRKAAAVSGAPRKKQRVPFPASGRASASFALLAT